MQTTTNYDAYNPNAAPVSADPNGAKKPTGGSFWSRHMHRFYLFFSFVVVVLTFVGIIMNLVKIVIKPSRILLDVYCLIFSLLAFSAELRQFAWARRIVYIWLQFFYIITAYRWRGVFYVCFGLLLLGDSAVMYVAGAISIVLGIVIFIFSYLLQLPEFEEAHEKKRMKAEKEAFNQHELQREEQDEHGIEKGGVFHNIGNKLADFKHKVHHSHKKDEQKEKDKKSAPVVPPTATTGPSNPQTYATPQKASETAFEPSAAAAAMFGGGMTTAATTMPARPSATQAPRANEGLQSSVATEPATRVDTMFASAEPAQPLREEGITRGGDSSDESPKRGESALRRDFKNSMNSSTSSSSMDIR